MPVWNQRTEVLWVVNSHTGYRHIPSICTND